jgi:hypothetical protein
VDWIRLAQDRDQLRAVVDTVINFGFRKRQWISWLAGSLSASEEELCSMELLFRLLVTWLLIVPSYLKCLNELLVLRTWTIRRTHTSPHTKDRSRKEDGPNYLTN